MSRRHRPARPKMSENSQASNVLPSISFEASRLKIQRARDHMAELERAISRFVDLQPVQFVTKESGTEAGYVDWELVATAEYPIYLAAILGDAIHNLRSALDLLATDLVRLNGQSPK